MAIPIEISDMAKQVLGRDATPQEIAAGKDKSVGELSDWLRSGAAGSSGGSFAGAISGGVSGGGDFGSILAEVQRQMGGNKDAQVSATRNSYQDRLNEVKSTTANELGQRGIPSTSTFYQQELQGAQKPVLNAQELAIANIQSGYPQEAINSALSIYQAQEAARQNTIQNSIYQQQLEAQKASLPLEQQLLQAQIGATNRSNQTGATSGMTAQDFLKMINSGAQTTQQTQPTAQYASSFASPNTYSYSQPATLASNQSGFNWDAFGLGEMTNNYLKNFSTTSNYVNKLFGF